jgi:hypothetical protein
MKKIYLFLLISAWLVFLELQAVPRAPEPASDLETPGSSVLLGDWITVHLKTMKSWRIPMQHFRQLAYTGIAFYESLVPGDKNYRPLAGQLNGFRPALPLPATTGVCWEASGNAAFAAMMRFFYPQDPMASARFDSLESAWKARLIREGHSESSVRAGADYGSAVARAVIEWSQSDGADKASDPYIIPKGTGLWEPTPPAYAPAVMPYEGNCRTLVTGSTDHALPPPPPAFSTDPQSPFYRMVDEVYTTSLRLSEEDKATGLFWDDFPDGMTLTAGGHWSSILKTVMTDRHTPLMEGACLYAALFISINDAAICCFKAKYMYNQIRPVTYIQKHMNHPDWNPLIVTPAHPEYPAAHASVSMSGATILTALLGDQVSFTDDSYAYRGYKAHHFSNFKEAGREAGISRLYGGIHYRPSIEAGYQLGAAVADNVAKTLVFKN